MTNAHNEVETRALDTLTAEVLEALKTEDATAARDALGEMEGIWMNTDCPDVRDRAAAFMHQYAAQGEYVRFAA